MAEEKKILIPGRLKNIAVSSYLAGASDIIDDSLGKNQQEINAEVTSTEEDLDTRLNVVEQLAEISVAGGEIGIATANDLKNRTAAGDAKIPTVAAVMDSADDKPTAGSTNWVTSGGVYNAVSGKETINIDVNENTYTIAKASNERTTASIPFQVGKTYRITMSVEQATNSTKYAYLYQTAGHNTPNKQIGKLLPNEVSATFEYTPDEETNYTNIGVYAIAAYNNPITFTVIELSAAKNMLSSDIVDNLIGGGTDKVLSAEQGKLLYGMSYEEPKDLQPYRTQTGKGIDADGSSALFGQWVNVTWLQLFYIDTHNVDTIRLTVPTYANTNTAKAGTIASKDGVKRSLYLIPQTGTNGFATIEIDTRNTDYIATSWWYGNSLAQNFSCKALHSSDINTKIDELESAVGVSVPSSIGGKEAVLLNQSNVAELTEGGKHYIITSEITTPTAITIGEGSVLDFRGGVLNGQYTGNNTRIIAEAVMIFRNTVISGTWQSKAYYCEWFADSDWAIKAEKCIAAFGAVKFVGRYVFSQNIDIKRIASVEFAQGSYVTVSDTFIYPYLFEVYFAGYFPDTYMPMSYDSIKFFGEGLIDMNGRTGFLRTDRSNHYNTNLTNLRVINFGVCEENASISHAYVELGNQECYVVNCSFSYKKMREPHQQYGLLLTHYDNKVIRTTIINTNIGISCKGGTFTDVHVWGWPKIGIVNDSSYLKMSNCYLDCCAEAVRLDSTTPFMITNTQIIGTSHSVCSDGHRYLIVTKNQSTKGIFTCQCSYEAGTEAYKHFAVRTESEGVETYTEYTPSSANVDARIL